MSPLQSSTIGAFSVVLICLIASVSADCTGSANNQPIYTNAPVLLNTTANGKLFIVNQVSPPLYVLHLYGTPYEMGLAQGTLLKTQMNLLYEQFFQYIYAQLDPYLKFLPPALRHAVEEGGVAAALGITYELTKDYIEPYWLQEFQGMSDGSGVPYDQIVGVHMFPEVIRAACSMYGAWGPATANASSPEALFQLRALDWSTDGPFQQWPVVTVYHPNEGNGHTFSILTWAGFVGAITGYSTAPVGICEKVWYGYNGTYSRSGIPWHFLLRDILQFDADINSALSRMANAHRTCAIFVGVGDYSNRFVAVGYSHDVLDIWDNVNGPTWPAHPKLNSTVYIDKHVQPSNDPCMGSLMQKYYGELDATAAIRYIAPIHQTGDMHIAVYDYAQNLMYVANASPANATGGGVIPAYDRAFVRLNMTQLFSEQQP